jgi:hypothetical protein
MERLADNLIGNVRTIEVAGVDVVHPGGDDLEAAIDLVNGSRDRPTGALRLNVPVSAERLVPGSRHYRQIKRQPRLSDVHI